MPGAGSGSHSRRIRCVRVRSRRPGSRTDWSGDLHKHSNVIKHEEGNIADKWINGFHVTRAR